MGFNSGFKGLSNASALAAAQICASAVLLMQAVVDEIAAAWIGFVE